VLPYIINIVPVRENVNLFFNLFLKKIALGELLRAMLNPRAEWCVEREG